MNRHGRFALVCAGAAAAIAPVAAGPSAAATAEPTFKAGALYRLCEPTGIQASVLVIFGKLSKPEREAAIREHAPRGLGTMIVGGRKYTIRPDRSMDISGPDYAKYYFKVVRSAPKSTIGKRLTLKYHSNAGNRKLTTKVFRYKCS